MLKFISHLILLAVGFFGGIYVGVHYQDKAQQIDQFRADEEAKVSPQVQAAVAKAKLQLIDRLQNTGGANSSQQAVLKEESDKANANLQQAQTQLGSH